MPDNLKITLDNPWIFAVISGLIVLLIWNLLPKLWRGVRKIVSRMTKAVINTIKNLLIGDIVQRIDKMELNLGSIRKENSRLRRELIKLQDVVRELHASNNDMNPNNKDKDKNKDGRGGSKK